MPTRIEATNGRFTGICSEASYRKDGATKGGPSGAANSSKLYFDLGRSNQWRVHRDVHGWKQQESFRDSGNRPLFYCGSDDRLDICFSQKMGFLISDRPDVFKLQRIRLGRVGTLRGSNGRGSLGQQQREDGQDDEAHEPWPAFVRDLVTDVDLYALANTSTPPPPPTPYDPPAEEKRDGK